MAQTVSKLEARANWLRLHAGEYDAQAANIMDKVGELRREAAYLRGCAEGLRQAAEEDDTTAALEAALG
jgi:hypothetical protein